MKHLCLLAFLSVPLVASATPVTYAIDNHHTFARFEYNHLGYTMAGGRFDKTSGTVTLDPENRSGSVDVTIDVRSISTGVPEFNEHLLSDDFLQVSSFPTIHFKSERLRFEGNTLSSVDGRLTIKGISRPVTLALSSFVCKPNPIFKKEFCGANASATIKRSDYKVGQYAPLVGDELTLTIGIEASRL